MQITPKLRKIVEDRLHTHPDGYYEWKGEHLDSIPVLRYKGDLFFVDQILSHMHIDLTHITKYKEEHEDLERFEIPGDNEDPGDGIGESQQ